jgi:pantothenate kinase
MPLSPKPKPPPRIVTLNARGVAALSDELVRRATDPHRRAILAVAGVPGSGKSTLAKAIVNRLNQQAPGSALLYPMDGFHLPNHELETLGLRNRKGASDTFDGQGYIKLLYQLRDARRTPAVPVFDRDLDEAVYTGRPEHSADANTRFVVTEGNYLLLESMPWNAVGDLCDLTVWIDTPMERAKKWIIERHMRFGRSPEAAEYWYETNDKLNAQHVLARSLHADRIARWPE